MWQRVAVSLDLMLFPTLGPSSLVVVDQPDERHANTTATVLVLQTQSILQHLVQTK